MKTVAARSAEAAPQATTDSAAKAAAVRSQEAKSTTAKKTTTRTTAGKTAAVRSATARTAKATAAEKSTGSKTTAARTAAAKAAAAKAAATRAQKAKEAKAAKAAEAQSEASDTVTTPAARVKPLVAADDAAPTVEAVPSPAGEPAAVGTAPSKTVEPEPVVESESGGPETEIAELLEPILEPEPEPVVAPVAEPPAEPAPEPQPDQPESQPDQPEPQSEPLPEPQIEPEPDASPTSEPDPSPQVAPDAAATAAVVTEVPAAAASDAIVVRELVKDFGDHRAVNGIDLTVPAGSFYGIVGPNGAGKTTTLSILAGLLRADSGDVTICGIDQGTDPLAAKRVMGVLPDRLRTFDRLTGRQLLYYYGLLRGLSADVIEKRTADLMRAFDLSGAVGRVVSDYSAGMTKKIMLAGAMIHSPRVLVLDEPFEAVDPVSSAVILDILRAYVSHGGTVILSSHGMDLVERVCSRVAIIVGGDVLAEGTIDEVRAGQTLESRFVELSGGIGEVEGLEWLHTFSD